MNTPSRSDHSSKTPSFSDIARAVGVTRILTVIIFMIGALAPAAAQSSTDGSTAELEEFRRDLGTALRQLNDQNEMIKGSILWQSRGASFVAASPNPESVQLKLEQMDYEELAILHSALVTHFPSWKEAPKTVGRVAQNLIPSGGAKMRADGKSSVTPDSCSDAYLADPSFSDQAATKGLEIAAAAAYEVVPEPINAPLVALWVPTAAAVTALETLNSIFDRCSGNEDVAEIKEMISTVETRVSEVGNSVKENDNDNTGAILRAIDDAAEGSSAEIINNNNAQTTTITTAITNAQTLIVNNDNSNAATIVNNDNANRLLIIQNGNANTAALTNMILRTQIEADLAEADSATFVGWYVAPAAKGGHFELARSIVADTIDKLAGENSDKANEILAVADAQLSAGNYKAAYRSLRMAYRTAVR